MIELIHFHISSYLSYCYIIAVNSISNANNTRITGGKYILFVCIINEQMYFDVVYKYAFKMKIILAFNDDINLETICIKRYDENVQNTYRY